MYPRILIPLVPLVEEISVLDIVFVIFVTSEIGSLELFSLRSLRAGSKAGQKRRRKPVKSHSIFLGFSESCPVVASSLGLSTF